MIAKLETGYQDELDDISFLGDSKEIIALDRAGRLHIWELSTKERKEIIPDWQQLFK